MHLRSLVLWAALFAVGSGCAKFTGRESDAGALADMNLAADAGVGVYLPTECAVGGPLAIDAEGNDLNVINDTDRPNVPYCACAPSSHGEFGKRWMTCMANESLEQCAGRLLDPTSSGCPEYATPERAMGCSFATPDSIPTCAAAQYSFEERCGTCGTADSLNACVIHATGEVECIVGTDTLASEPLCARYDGATGAGVFSNANAPQEACKPNADCYFDVDGTARCAEPAEPRPLYPVRGCPDTPNAESCYVGSNSAPAGGESYTTRNNTLTARQCTAMSRAGTWSGAYWSYNAVNCGEGLLCDLSGTSPTCTSPSWSAVGSGSTGLCGDCVGVPCFVYEDGSHECMHRPTRNVDATRASETTVGCCQRLPGGGFQPGTCSVGGGFVFPGLPTECGESQPCTFTPAGIAGCT